MLRTFFLLASLAFMLPASAQDNAAPGVQRLHAAASRGDARVMATLLDHGVPVDGRNNKGETALLLAVQAGHTLIADMLVARGGRHQRSGSQQGYSLAVGRRRRANGDA